MRLKRKFYQQSALKLAQALLGKVLARKIGRKKICAVITETEAYMGPHDKASHSFGNKLTKRNWPMFLDGGCSYVYLVYGLHYQFNIVANHAGYPEAVLIRGIELANKSVAGPGRVTKYLKIGKELNAANLANSKKIWLEDRGFKIGKIKREPRVGIDYAGSLAIHRHD